MAHSPILIAYFSHSGNTQVMAEQIREITGGDLFKIVTVDPYPADYDAVVDVAGKEQKEKHRPELSMRVLEMAAYKTVFIGYPNWWATMPMAVFSFLEEYDFSGKNMIPFCTHEGSALGRSVDDIRKLCPNSDVSDGLAIKGGSMSTARRDVMAWLKRIGLAK